MDSSVAPPKIGEQELRARMRAAMPAFPSGADAGLRKREYFAVLILQGMVANPERSGAPEDFASDAVALADALVAELLR